MVDTAGTSSTSETDSCSFRLVTQVCFGLTLLATQRTSLSADTLPANLCLDGSEHIALSAASVLAFDAPRYATMEPLDRLDGLLHSRGAVYESDIFLFLRSLPMVVRAHEFGLVDGALSIDADMDANDYSSRFWEAEQTSKDPWRSPRWLLFDVKSKVSRHAVRQNYVATTLQQAHVAFFLGFCAADPRYLEVIPNFAVTQQREDLQSPGRYTVINSARGSRFPPSAYGLDPAKSPYRMPLAFVPEALLSIRELVRTGKPYQNPWNRVTFDQWAPSAATSFEALRPAEGTGQSSASEAVIDLYRRVNKQNPQRQPISLEFMSLQPRIADFKLVVDQDQSLKDPRLARQYFVQHKLDARYRAPNVALSNVSICRNQDGWYFSHTDRFDFLFYQFDFLPSTTAEAYTQFFFLPEFVLPDSFYTGTLREVSFEREDFAPFRISRDADGRWIDWVWAIIERYPSPRQAEPRPLRAATGEGWKGEDPKAQAASAQVEGQDGLLRHAATPPAERGRQQQRFSQLVSRWHRRFYYSMMDQCARRRRGMLLVLDREHPMGDFAFCDRIWLEAEAVRYLEDGTPPTTLDSLPPDMPMTLIYCFAREVPFNSSGPVLTLPQFRRLDSCHQNRLLIWDLWAPDDRDPPHPLIVIPTEDLGPTDAQRLQYQRHAALKKGGIRAHDLPRIPHLLRHGRVTSDYVLGPRGPRVYETSPWDHMWDLCLQFARRSPEHPSGSSRCGASYRHPLSTIHERLVREHIWLSQSATAEPVP